MKLKLLLRELSVFKSTVFILLLLLLTTTKGFSQCAYTGLSNPKVGSDNIFCVDNGNTIKTATVNAGQYVVVNVVKGFTYTFSVGNVFTNNSGGFFENLTLFDGTNTPLAYVRGPDDNGAILNWTATVTGQVKLQLSKSAGCTNDNSVGGSLTLTLNSVGNTQDNQNSFGTDNWVGHVYNLSTTAIPPGGTSPTGPSATYPFTTANYVGYYNVTTETINEGFGGDTACFPVTSAVTNIYTETFAVRYKMRSTKTGYYFLNVTGDDGVRVYVDGVLVFNQWQEQSETAYCNNLIYLNGNSTIVFDYYENGGQNVAKLSLTPFNSGAANVISPVGPLTVCSGTSPGNLSGNSYASTCTAQTISTITYQWQVSSDNTTWSNIATRGNSQNYTVPTITTSTDSTLYYRRLVKSTGANDANGGVVSNVVTVNTNASTVGGTVAAAQTICSGTAPADLTLSGQTGAVIRWERATNIGFTAGLQTISSTATTLPGGTIGNLTANTYFRAVVQNGSCSVANSGSVLITVTPVSVGGTVSAPQTICSGTSPAALILSGQTGTVVKWQKSTDATFNSGVVDIPFTATTLPSGSIGTLTTNTYFRAVVQSGTCSVANSAPVLITVNPVSVGGTVAAAQTICSGTSPADLTLSGQTGLVLRWQKSADAAFTTPVNITSTSTTLASAIIGNLTTNTYFRAVVQSGSCSVANSAPVLIKVYDLLGDNNIFYSNGTSGQVNATPAENGSAILTAPSGTYFATVNFASYGTPTGTAPNFVVNTVCHSATSQIRSEEYLLGKTGSVTIPATNAVFGDPCVGTVKKLYILASYAENICNGNPVTITGNTPAGGVLSYRWESSTTSATTGFAPATGINDGINYTSGALTQTTWFKRIVSSCGESNTSSIVMVIVNPVFTAGAIANTGQTICSGNNPGIIGSTTPASGGNGTIIYSWRSSADGYVAAIAGAISATYTPPSGLAVTTSYRRYVAGGTCNPTATASTNTWTVTVTPINTVGAASASPTVCLNSPLPAITHATTGATGIGTITNLPAGVTASWSGNMITISGTPTASGTFNYSIPLTGGCGNITATGTITVGGVTTYNGTTWVGGNPDIYKTAIFNADYNTTSGNITACNCQIQAGNTLTIGANSSATIQNNIINNGTVIVESDGNLVQISDAGTYSGAAKDFLVKRNANLKRLDYNYWASPVKGQQLKAFSPGTVASRFLVYDEKDDFFYPITNTYNFGTKIDGTFESEAKGYAIRANNNYPATDALQLFEGKFTGIPNNGVITFPLQATRNGYNLVGNPYASNLDFDTLFNNNSANINYIAYFWTNVNPNPAMQGQGYPGIGFTNNYAVLNGTGGVPATGTAAPGGGTKKPNQFVKVGQGFIVKAKNAADLQFKNAVRTNNSTSVFFNKNGSTPDRYWLKLQTPLEVVTTQLIGYLPQATNGFELDYDAPLMVLGSDAFYSVLDNRKLAIQGKAPFVNNDVVALGSSQYEAGNYTITLGEKEGVFANGQQVYLKDKQTGILTNLSEGNYTFSAVKGITEGRFEIVYQPENVLANDASAKDGLVVYRDGGDFVIKSFAKNITRVEVYDASGRLMTKLQNTQKEIRLDASGFVNGMYLLKIDQQGTVTTKKIRK